MDSTNRLDIFRQLTNDPSVTSRRIQIVCEDPESLHPPLDSFGELESNIFTGGSMLATFRTQYEATQAYLHYMQDYTVYYCTSPASSLIQPLHIRQHSDNSFDNRERSAIPRFSYTENLFHDVALSLPSETSTVPSPALTLSSERNSFEDSKEERKKLRRQPMDDIERQKHAINIDKVMNRTDLRTAVMIRNIPNKYTQPMLREAIDKEFSRTYTFLYLPIDYRYQCNMGYAFINFIDASVIPRFYERFNNKGWERFNSDKICELTYARIQGHSNLLDHIKSTSVMHKHDPNVKPVIINPN